MPTRPAPLILFPSELLPSLPNTTSTAGPKTPALLTRIAQEKVYSFYGRFLDHAQQEANAEAALPDKPRVAQACWLAVRMFKPSREYEVPRWHCDGRIFACSCSGSISDNKEVRSGQVVQRQLPHYKFAVTLLGPATRVLVPSAVVDDALAADMQNRRGLDESISRAELADALKGCEEYTVQRGQVIRFSWGQDDSPVHSEPDFGGEDRVFVSVLFGSEEEIRDMCQLRQTLFGVEALD